MRAHGYVLKVDDVEYKSLYSHGCGGCAAQRKRALCNKINQSSNCGYMGVIWVEADSAAKTSQWEMIVISVPEIPSSAVYSDDVVLYRSEDDEIYGVGVWTVDNEWQIGEKVYCKDFFSHWMPIAKPEDK